MKTKAFAYQRVSGKGQVEGDGFTRQGEAIDVFAKSNNVEILRTFRDEGVSGSDGFDREALSELLVALKAGDIRTVVIERPDRLARQLVMGEILLEEFRKLGVSVISAESGLELTTENENPEKTLIRHILGAIAQWEKSVIVQKLRAARNRLRKQTGRCEGRKPYGFRPDEAAVIASIKKMRSDGHSLELIANTLNSNGVKPRTLLRGGRIPKFHPTMIQRILTKL